jgi:hypothetical protein
MDKAYLVIGTKAGIFLANAERSYGQGVAAGR